MKLDWRKLRRVVDSPRWFVAFLIGVAICGIVLLVQPLTSESSPGNVWGIAYGSAATALLVGAGLYGLRRRMPRRGPGSARNWLQFHVYGGTLFVLLIGMHTGFRRPDGALAWALWVSSLCLVGSGMIGIAIQRWIPRLITSGLSTEVLYDRIPELVEVIRKRADNLAASCDEHVREFYHRSLAPSLESPRVRLIYYMDITGGIQSQTRQFNYVRAFLPEGEVTKLNELEELHKTKLEIDAHYTLQKTLRWWLYGHVPLSVVLFVLVTLHILSILYY